MLPLEMINAQRTLRPVDTDVLG